jgi:hypothetical protein
VVDFLNVFARFHILIDVDPLVGNIILIENAPRPARLTAPCSSVDNNLIRHWFSPPRPYPSR